MLQTNTYQKQNPGNQNSSIRYKPSFWYLITTISLLGSIYLQTEVWDQTIKPEPNCDSQLDKKIEDLQEFDYLFPINKNEKAIQESFKEFEIKIFFYECVEELTVSESSIQTLKEHSELFYIFENQERYRIYLRSKDAKSHCIFARLFLEEDEPIKAVKRMKYLYKELRIGNCNELSILVRDLIRWAKDWKNFNEENESNCFEREKEREILDIRYHQIMDRVMDSLIKNGWCKSFYSS